ncbi:MAG TPA: 6-carboxytetrahydropterin synthase [Chloroflexota bacterium]|nr:6-carboxytetrahydropterin synthase [Chloroflexota bacterium]
MFEVGIVGTFEAAHRLKGEFGPASNLHGHTYRVDVSVRGQDLRSDGTLFDITVLQSAVNDTLSSLDYHDLDELPAFREGNSTAEKVAHFIYGDVAPRLAGWGLRSLSIRVWESPAAFAGYEDNL